MSGVDWGDGAYEVTAATIAPAADVLLDAFRIAPGMRLLDVGCGTGNVALAAAARGAQVTAVDPSAELVARAGTRPGADAVTWGVMEGEELPVAPASFDVVASCFAVIFAPDPAVAGAGLRRAVALGGRIGITAWLPEGAIAEAGRSIMGRLAPGRAAPRWFAPEVAAELLDGDVTVTRHGLAFTASSPEAWLAEQVEHHPVWRMAWRSLPDEALAEVTEETHAALRARNEDPSGFRTTSPYVVVLA